MQYSWLRSPGDPRQPYRVRDGELVSRREAEIADLRSRMAAAAERLDAAALKGGIPFAEREALGGALAAVIATLDEAAALLRRPPKEV